MKHKYSIVVNSCDAYEDVWEPFFLTFRDYFGIEDIDIVLNTETKKYNLNSSRIRALELSCKNISWGKRFRLALDKIETEYVLCLYDDFILEKEVDKKNIDMCVSWLEKDPKIAVFYLNNIEGKNEDSNKYNGFEKLPQRKDYKLNSSPGIWRKETLMRYIEDNDNPWAWEFFGSARTYNSEDEFYCVSKGNEAIYPYSNRLGGAIHRGKWVKSVIEPVIEKYNLNIDTSIRGIEDENNTRFPHSFLWKIRFFAIGIKMVGIKSVIFVYRSIKKRVLFWRKYD